MVPKGVNVGLMHAKKDEVDAVIPELVSFTYTKELQEMYPNVNLASGEKAKMFMYNKLTLNAKKECMEMKPIFTPTAFLNDTRQFDDDGFVDKLYNDWDEAKLADEVKCSFPGVPKQDKAALCAFMSKLTDVRRELVKGCPTVTMPSGKDDSSDAMAHVSYKFTWDASLNEMLKTELAHGAAVELKSYDSLKLKAGKVIEFHMLFDPATNIKPVGKSGGN